MFFRRLVAQGRSSLAHLTWELNNTNLPRETAAPADLTKSSLPHVPITTPKIVLAEASLPPELSVRRLGEIAARLPVRLSHTGEPGFFAGDIRRGGILRFQYDGADDLRIEIVKILSDPKVIDFFSTQFGERRCAADCQLHRMSTGSFLAEHTHRADNIFVVFHFRRDYQGGAYFERHHGKRYYPDIKAYSACISRNAAPHGVEEVLAGERMVLVTSWAHSSCKR